MISHPDLGIKWETDGIGRDLTSGLIHGTRISLMVGLVSMGIAALIGIILGALAGFFGDTKLKMPRIKYWLTLFGIFMGLFYGFSLRKYELSEGFGIGFGAGMWEMFISILVIIGITILFPIFEQFTTLWKIKGRGKCAN